MKGGKSGRNFGRSRVTIIASDASTKPVCLYNIRKRAAKLPVEFIQTIRVKDHTATDAAARCSLDHEFNTTEVEVEL